MFNITPEILNLIKNTMLEKEMTPRTTTYALVVVRQVFNFAKNHNLYSGNNPVRKIKKPSSDNRRMRFLTKKEAGILLEYLSKASKQLHDIALLSLHCGLRAGEIFNLTWNDVDFENEVISVKDTKSGRNRSAIMAKDVKNVPEANKKSSNANRFILTSTIGTKIPEVSNTKGIGF